MRSINLDTLPDDILIQVFLYKPNYERQEKPDNSMGTLLSISHTNRALRRRVLSIPCLWSTLRITIGYCKNGGGGVDPRGKARDEGLLNLFRLWIGRSGEVPLSYKINIRGETLAAIYLIKYFSREKYRWKSVKFSYTSEESQRIAFNLGLKIMPRLQRLTIASFEDGDQVKKDVDLSRSTQLRYLSLGNVKISRWRSIMDTIHTQQLTELRLDLAVNDLRTINRGDNYLITTLGMFTNLKRFEICCDEYFTLLRWTGPPVLLPKLCMLVVNDGCGSLLQYIRTPSLVSLYVDDSFVGRHLHRFLRRSRPPLEIMGLAVDYLRSDDILCVLEDLPNVRTLLLTRDRVLDVGKESDESDENERLEDIWYSMTMTDSTTDVLLPNLTNLIYHPYFVLEEENFEELACLAEALLSRRRHSKNFRFYVPEGLKFSEDFSYHLKILLCSMVDTLAAHYDPRHLDRLFPPQNKEYVFE